MDIVASKLICGPGLLRLFGELRMKFTQGAAPAVFRFFKPSSNHIKSNFQPFHGTHIYIYTVTVYIYIYII